jgi:hypothetical protein
MTYIEELQDAIRRLHHSESRHVETVSIEEVFQDQVVWEGEVEVFDLIETNQRIYGRTIRIYRMNRDRQ